MFIHEMSEEECRQVLHCQTVGRLACARDNQPYVVPMRFAFDGTYLYGFTTVGQKVEWLRSNPRICFETDEVISDTQWTSVVVFGKFEELTDTPEHKGARIMAHELLHHRANWWEPAYMSQQHRDQPHSLVPVYYRIHIAKMTGHRATPNHNG
jgi:nitroimidazol reductase NimA-like FMN-containing flavoprotein (pyridoxamine 5'-phosphate oxidase superfamily)